MNARPIDTRATTVGEFETRDSRFLVIRLPRSLRHPPIGYGWTVGLHLEPPETPSLGDLENIATT